MNEPLAIMGTPHMGFFSLVFIGGMAGWIASMAMKSGHGIFTNILVGIAGSFVASQLADILNLTVRGTLGHLVAAIIGSLIVLYVWRMLHPARIGDNL